MKGGVEPRRRAHAGADRRAGGRQRGESGRERGRQEVSVWPTHF